MTPTVSIPAPSGNTTTVQASIPASTSIRSRWRSSRTRTRPTNCCAKRAAGAAGEMERVGGGPLCRGPRACSTIRRHSAPAAAWA